MIICITEELSRQAFEEAFALPIPKPGEVRSIRFYEESGETKFEAAIVPDRFAK